jgi:hypothetical protein
MVNEDDLQYTIDLGLVYRGQQGPQIANPIYREIIPRQLTNITQANLESMIDPHVYVLPDGRLDITKLLVAFQEFFRMHSEHWVERFDYKEAGPQLLIQAFLQRIVNGGGRIEREYGLGHRRTDLLIIWNYPQGIQRVVIELKILYSKLEQTIQEGLAQTAYYMDRCATDEGHLIIFDRAIKKAWSKKIFRKERVYQAYSITVWGM